MSTFPGAFVPVAPPADGLRLAFAAARRRRNTKAGATGAAGLLSVLLVLATTGGAGNRTLLQEPLPPAHGGFNGVVTGTVPSPAATFAPTSRVASAISLAGSTSTGRQRVVAAAGTAPLAGSTGAARLRATSLRPSSGPMTRDYTYSTGGGDLICPARKQQQGERVLCADVSAYTYSTGVLRITAEICNFDTRAETLDYATARELDINVRHGATEVWRWSTGRHFDDAPHELAVPVGQCVAWSTDWAQRDSSGRPVAAGTYDVAADFDAEQLPAPDRHASYSTTLS
jgi:hypothetical protein